MTITIQLGRNRPSSEFRSLGSGAFLALLLLLLLVALQLHQSNGFPSLVSSSLSLRPNKAKQESLLLLLHPSSLEEDGPDGSVGPFSRRSVIRDSSGLVFLVSQWAALIGNSDLASAAEGTSTQTPTATTTTTTTNLPKITDRVAIDVRISRPDGTFYVKGDESDALVKFYTIKIGLFGTAAPTHVERFLSYIRPSEEVLKDDRPFPSYGQSVFKSFDQANGILVGGTIPSLEETVFAGSTALRYGGRILPAPLWLEKKSTAETITESLPLPHSAKGLLLHRKLDVTPTFGITTRSDSGTYVSDVDREFVAFGTVLNEEGMEFLKYCQDLPTYSGERPVQDEENLVQDAAKAVFDSQRDFFRGFAKTLGDTRVAKIFPGKLLRRVEVTKVTLL